MKLFCVFLMKTVKEATLRMNSKMRIQARCRDSVTLSFINSLTGMLLLITFTVKIAKK